MYVGDGWALTRASSYSACVVAAARGPAQRGVIHSVFPAAANITFPGDFVLSLNAVTSPCMPNGLQLSALPGTFPFSVLRAGMPVLFGAQRLLIESVDCSIDLSSCIQWDPHIERPAQLDMEIVTKNRDWLLAWRARTPQTGSPPGVPLFGVNLRSAGSSLPGFQGCPLIVSFPPSPPAAASKKRKRSISGTPRTPAKGGCPLQSCSKIVKLTPKRVPLHFSSCIEHDMKCS